MVGWTGVRHIEGDDYSEVIDCALKNNGFKSNQVAFKKFASPSEMCGYGH